MKSIFKESTTTSGEARTVCKATTVSSFLDIAALSRAVTGVSPETKLDTEPIPSESSDSLTDDSADEEVPANYLLEFPLDSKDDDEETEKKIRCSSSCSESTAFPTQECSRERRRFSFWSGAAKMLEPALAACRTRNLLNRQRGTTLIPGYVIGRNHCRHTSLYYSVKESCVNGLWADSPCAPDL
ncbi:hypothetical protein TNCV_3440451 [Trichonephila clavipes]|uniref:Uncharacterized protein n=1 Tax=Trichonephila clavipes TaxID=2585209 RepID=A0A8X6W5L9_TRICX|nr:hypothetical protein TNCV_3440451 [Trichonephila clavipes]